jgi:hypothetical protein
VKKAKEKRKGKEKVTKERTWEWKITEASYTF